MKKPAKGFSIKQIIYLICILLLTLSVTEPARASNQKVAAGALHSLQLRADGTLWAWGYNYFGQLGDSTTTDRYSPVQVGTDTDWTDISAGYGHSLGIKSDGTLWAWGNNGNGQLGDGTTVNKTTPIQVGTDTDWTDIAGGYYHSLAIKSDGTLWALGNNGNGQLGDGTTVNKTTPIQVGTDTDWTDIAGGALYSLGTKSDGTLWAWGNNIYGQIGDGTTVNKATPVQVGTDTDWTDITAGDYHALAIKSDGTLWAWGWNGGGQLGDSTTVNKTTPVQVGTDTDWTNISAGYAHSLGIKSDGTLWAWGASGQDQLGVGTVTNRKAPVRVGTDTDWTDITAGDFHSLGIKSDGTLWAWGYNYYGQLGDGTTLNKNTPSMLPNQDTDCDGVNNDVDNCPAVANPLQQDADTDTIGDACDSDTIYGTISGDIQAGVTVDLYITSCGGDILEATTVTDANGYYSLGDLSSQRYLLVAEETGYSFVPASDFVDIPQAEIQSYDFVATEIVRFIDNGDGTVKDTLTDLIWLKNANCYGHQDWYAAIDNATNLNSGECGLSDGSAEGDWHLATRDELQEIGTDPPTTWSSGMPDTWYMPGPPFVNVQSFYYWSSTEDGNGWAWFFAMSNGSMGMSSQDNKYRYVWPVRSGN